MIYTSPDGIRYDQHEANRLSTLDNLIILCGHYKGIDYRIREHLVTREISSATTCSRAASWPPASSPIR